MGEFLTNNLASGGVSPRNLVGANFCNSSLNFFSIFAPLKNTI